MEPMAARGMSQPGVGCQCRQERLTYFTRGPEWSDRDVRPRGARYALAAMTARGAGNGLDHRRYGLPEAGHALRGRATTVFGHNRQDRQLPVWRPLDHLPHARSTCRWTRAVPARELDRGSIAAGRGPHPRTRVTFKTKPELGVEMIERAIADGLPAGLVLADSGMATTPSFAGACRCEVWLRRRLTPYTTGVRLDLLGPDR